MSFEVVEGLRHKGRGYGKTLGLRRFHLPVRSVRGLSATGRRSPHTRASYKLGIAKF